MDTLAQIQSRLDAFKTDKERKLRIKKLAKFATQRGGYSSMDRVVEYVALCARVEHGELLTAEETFLQLHQSVLDGKIIPRPRLS